MSKVEHALILIKPDGIKKSLTGNVITKLSAARLLIIGAKMIKVSRELAERHYAEHKGKAFYDSLIEYIQGNLFGEPFDRVMAMVYTGEDAIKKLRNIVGATNPEEAEATSIRGSYGRVTTKGVFENVAHCSSSPESAEYEIKLWFDPDDLTEAIYPSKKVVFEKVEKKVWA
ncbi:MAG: nucleoside-diphosphate kinase [Endomicrobiia bacterium]|nr:nucleoside-diphosphate kinase [Endomicrobiia bacterium]